MVLNNNKSTVICLVLLLAFFIQYGLKLEWSWLLQLQQQEMYKRWSGLFLAIFILFQWLLSLTRTVKKW